MDRMADDQIVIMVQDNRLTGRRALERGGVERIVSK